MCGKLEVVVSVSARRRNDVDWIVNELWMKRLFVEVRLKGLAEQDDDDGCLFRLGGLREVETALLSGSADLDLDERDARRRLEWCL